MKKFVIGIVIILIGLISVFLFDSDDVSSIKVVNYNGTNLMISVDGVSSSTLPTSGDYYLSEYDCNNKNTILSWDNTNYQLKVTNNNKKAGVSCYLEFETNPKLSDMEAGSYVSFVGNNGCNGETCNGQNANYVNDIDMGYCSSSYSSNKFITNGWRIAYVKNNTAYLVSAGSPECVDLTNYTISNSKISELDAYGVKYCNKNYAYGGICDTSNSWVLGYDDYNNIIGSSLSSCSIKSCGALNDLIDNGGYYWYNYSSDNVSMYYQGSRSVDESPKSYDFGIRPVLRLDSNVLVTGGTGTYEDPYTIGNNAFWINDGSATVSDANKSSVNLSLLTVDATQMCISTDTSVCTNYVAFSTSYTLDWSNEEAGEKVVYVYYKNSDGRVVAAMNKTITLLES